jgi:hypothetical protein
MKTKPIKLIKIKPYKKLWINERHDTDRDKVHNFRDCNPWNPKQHKISKTMRKEVNMLPITFLYDNRIYDIKEKQKKQPKEVREMKRSFYSTIHRRPDVITEMKKAQTDVNFLIAPHDKEDGCYGEFTPGRRKKDKSLIEIKAPNPSYYPSDEKIDYGPWIEQHEDAENAKFLFRMGYSLDDINTEDNLEEIVNQIKEEEIPISPLVTKKEISKNMPDTIHHELTHYQQYKSTTKQEFEKKFEGEYYNRIGEVEARNSAKKKEEEFKRKRKIPPESYELLDNQTDTDNDGTPDVEDNEPLNPNKN